MFEFGSLIKIFPDKHGSVRFINKLEYPDIECIVFDGAQVLILLEELGREWIRCCCRGRILYIASSWLKSEKIKRKHLK